MRDRLCLREVVSVKALRKGLGLLLLAFIIIIFIIIIIYFLLSVLMETEILSPIVCGGQQ